LHFACRVEARLRSDGAFACRVRLPRAGAYRLLVTAGSERVALAVRSVAR